MKSVKIAFRDDFFFGNCGLCAVAAMFNLSLDFVRSICISKNIMAYEGLSTEEFNEIMTIIHCVTSAKITKSIPERKTNFKQYLKNITNKEQNLILVLDEHIACFKNGVLIDSFLFGTNSLKLSIDPWRSKVHVVYKIEGLGEINGPLKIKVL